MRNFTLGTLRLDKLKSTGGRRTNIPWIYKYLLEQRQTLKRAMPSYAGILKYRVVPSYWSGGKIRRFPPAQKWTNRTGCNTQRIKLDASDYMLLCVHSIYRTQVLCTLVLCTLFLFLMVSSSWFVLLFIPRFSVLQFHMLSRKFFCFEILISNSSWGDPWVHSYAVTVLRTTLSPFVRPITEDAWITYLTLVLNIFVCYFVRSQHAPEFCGWQ
jgi:hypothetical protein